MEIPPVADERAFVRVGDVEVATIEGVRLWWEAGPSLARLTVERHDASSPAPPARPLATLHFAVGDGRVKVALVLLGGRREIDVSIQPSVVLAAIGAGAPPSATAQRQVCDWLVRFADAHGTWRPPPELPTEPGLLAMVGGGAYPLLGAALERGAGPLPEVPRWAAPVVACPDARSAARHAFGTRATRPVVGALAASLVPADGGRLVALYPLALALMAPALGPDRLARVIRAPGPHRPPEVWPDGEAVAAARDCTPHLGEHRAERLLLDAAAVDDGPALLSAALCAYGLVRHRTGQRLPNRLAEFRAHCASLLPPDPNPDGLVVPPRRRRAAAPRPVPAPTSASLHRPQVVIAEPPPPPPRTPAQRRGAMYVAPATAGRRVEVNQLLALPVNVAALAGREVAGAQGRLRFLVPRTAAELAEWGRRLHNCVGGFATAVHEGRSWLLGIESGDCLAYCIEVNPRGTIRQFLGEHNRQVPRGDALAVVEALAAAGLVARADPHNAPWFEPVASLPAGRPRGRR